jgi:hypothetical protein
MAGMDYKIIMAGAGITGTDAVNKFTTNNPDWRLYNVVPIGTSQEAGFGFIFERPKKEKPDDSTPGGALKDAALLTENNVVPLRRVA